MTILRGRQAMIVTFRRRVLRMISGGANGTPNDEIRVKRLAQDRQDGRDDDPPPSAA
jgi:hypothetical protein